MIKKHVVFLINLLQDINISRPLVFMASLDLGFDTAFLICNKFIKRDGSGAWQKELSKIGKTTGTQLHYYESEFEALQFLQDKTGILVSASESHLSAHTPTHDVFRLAPKSFKKITLQHGFECIGFLHSKDHSMAHGESATFAADIICGWSDASRLTSIHPSQRPKLYVTGPTSLLQTPPRSKENALRDGGLICENLHSVRLNTAGDFKVDFINIFNEFCAELEKTGQKVTLRPHPGGQYMLKNNIPIPPNVVLNNSPMYKVDLSRFSYGISAPSSVIIDMLLAQIPVAVWRDEIHSMDSTNYSGLAEISNVKEWLDFKKDATERPNIYLDLQKKFLDKIQISTDPKEVYQRFATLFLAGTDFGCHIRPESKPKERVLLVANGFIPTLQFSFMKPLSELITNKRISIDLLTEQMITRKFKKITEQTYTWLSKFIEQVNPTCLIFCRYSGELAFELSEYARTKNIPIIFHIDDDLLNVPIEIGIEKYRIHNDPKRLARIRYFLQNADVVYCSTLKLKEHFKSLFPQSKAQYFSGKIVASGTILKKAQSRKTIKIGYMGIDHEHDLKLILPALTHHLRKNNHIHFELFGRIPKPPELEEFGERIICIPFISNYEEFLYQFSKLDWDIGICPLAKTNFNFLKSNIKWVEYTSIGTAVIASKGSVYDECCADGCGLLVDTIEEWSSAFEYLSSSPENRYKQVLRAQKKLTEEYSHMALRNQVMHVLNLVKKIRRISTSTYKDTEFNLE